MIVYQLIGTPALSIDIRALNNCNGSLFLQLAPLIALGVRISGGRMSAKPIYAQTPMPCQSSFMLPVGDRDDLASHMAQIIVPVMAIAVRSTPNRNQMA